MLITAQLPKNLWPETIHHTVWLKNRTSTQALNGKTPYKVMHNLKLNLRGLPDWGVRVFTLKTTSGKLNSKSNEGRWLGYSGVSKGHHIYGPNHQISVKRNVTFKNNVLEVPSLSAGEEDNNQTVKSSNQNMTIQNMSNKSNQQQPHNPSADIISHDPSNGQNTDTSKMLVNNIIGDLEKSSPRCSQRLNPPLAQPSEQEPWQSKQLKQQQSSNLLMIEDLNDNLISAMIFIADQIIDPLSIEAAREQDDWPEWEIPSMPNSIYIKG